jgi:uncharacterized damage-inducible protein DinB
MSHSDLITAYVAGIDSLQPAIEGLSHEQLRARPIAGQWSTLEVLCHLADTEAVFADRMKRVLAEDRPPLLAMDPDQYITSLACDQRDATEEIAVVRTTRQQMARILRSLPPEAWQRIGVHNQAGEQTLEQLVRKAVDHLKHHLEFIRAKRAALKL